MTKKHGLSLHPTEHYLSRGQTPVRTEHWVRHSSVDNGRRCSLRPNRPRLKRYRMGMWSTRRRTWAATSSVLLRQRGRMYDTLVNIQSGPRVLGETFTMRTVEGTRASSAGFAFGLQELGLRRRSEQLRQAGLLQGQALRVLRNVPPRPPVRRLRPAGRPGQLRTVDSLRSGQRCCDRGVAGVAPEQRFAGDVQHRAANDGHQPDVIALSEGDVPRWVLAEHLPGPDTQPRPIGREV